MARTNISKNQLRFPLDNRNRDRLHTKLAEHDTALDTIEANVTTALGTQANAVVAVAATPGALKVIPILIPDAATADYDYITAEKVEIIDVEVIKDAAGAGNTIQVKTGAGVAISNAIAAAVDLTVTRAGTITLATRVIAAGGTIRITATRAAGSMAASVFLYVIERA